MLSVAQSVVLRIMENKIQLLRQGHIFDIETFKREKDRM